MTRASNPTHASRLRVATRTLPQSPPDALDADRTASMADEGGRSGAKMDLRDQLASAVLPARTRKGTSAALWWGAAGAAAGLVTGLLWARLRRPLA